MNHVAVTDPTEEHRQRIPVCRGDASGLAVCRIRASEISLQPKYATHPRPRADLVGNCKTFAADRDHCVKRVFRFFKMRLLLEVERVGKQCWSKELRIALVMSLSRRAHNAAEMRRLGAFPRQLGAVALRRRPLIAENIGRRRLAIGVEQIDKPQCQKCALTQQHLGRSGWLIGHPLQKDSMGQSGRPRGRVSAHREPAFAPGVPNGKTITDTNIAPGAPVR